MKAVVEFRGVKPNGKLTPVNHGGISAFSETSELSALANKFVNQPRV